MVIFKINKFHNMVNAFFKVSIEKPYKTSITILKILVYFIFNKIRFNKYKCI